MSQALSQQEQEIDTLRSQRETLTAQGATGAAGVWLQMMMDHERLVGDLTRALRAGTAGGAGISGGTASGAPISGSAGTPGAVGNLSGDRHRPRGLADDRALVQLIQQTIQAHQQAIGKGQQLIAQARSPRARALLSRGGQIAARHVEWLQSLANRIRLRDLR